MGCKVVSPRTSRRVACANRTVGRVLNRNIGKNQQCKALFGGQIDERNEYRDLKGEERGDYGYQDADDYFNCMGMLAAEGTYDRLEEWLDAGVDPIDMILLMACEESDVPKVEEVLRAGAAAGVVDPRTGKTPMDVCSDDEVLELLSKSMVQ